jgi:hypothetical protein
MKRPVIAEGLLNGFPAGAVCLSGHGAEIARCFYYSKEHPERVDAGFLARCTGMLDDGRPNRLAERHFARWLDEASAVEDYGLRALDLFYWEQRVGCWAADGQAQWDIVHDRLPVFGCRDLLTAMLGVDWHERVAPHYQLCRDVMRAMWPEVLAFPFNPRQHQGRHSRLWRAIVESPIGRWRLGRGLSRRLS